MGRGRRRWRSRRGLLVAVLLVSVAVTGAPGATGPAPAEAGQPMALAVTGDSLSARGRSTIIEMVEQDRPVEYWRKIGGSFVAHHLDATLAEVTEPDGPDILVPILGHAQASVGRLGAWERQLRRFLDAVTPHVECVRWFNVQTTRSYYVGVNRNGRAFNAVLRRVAQKYPEVEVFHYDAWRSRARPEHVLADLLHLTPLGHRELGHMVRAAANGCDPTRSSGPFWDVPDDHPRAEAINWLASEGIVGGYDNRTYRAEVGTIPVRATRAQALAMLWRAEGSPGGHRPHHWIDGPRHLDAALRWAAARQIVPTPGRRFLPAKPVTRSVLVTMLWRAAGRPAVGSPNPWPGADPALDGALRWAGVDPDGDGPRRPLLDGVVGPAFRGPTPVTRGQLALILYRDAGHEPGA